MKKSMKSKLAMFAVAGAMAVSGTVGIAAPAKAENVHTNNAGTVVTCKESYSNTDNELFTLATITADMVIVRTDVNIIRQRFMYIQQ
mgnify:CR=1 FL=1